MRAAQRVVVGGLALAACGPAPSQRRGAYQPPASSAVITSVPIDRDPVVLVPQPPVDLLAYTPDFHDELRWPLTAMTHPSLEPRFAIAQALAQPGIGWIDLCGLGAQNRYGRDTELLSYLRGWCSAIKGDTDTACTHLVPLVGSTKLGIDDAIKLDLANILADSGHADKAEHWINRHRIRNVEVLDLLAANYVEVGTPEDALAINRLAMQTDDHATLATRCTRLARQIVLAGNRDSPALEYMKSLATPNERKLADPTCTSLHHKLACWANDDCRAWMGDLGFSDTQVTALKLAVAQWRQAKTFSDWRRIADSALLAVPLEGSAELALAAFDNALRTARACSATSRRWLDDARPMLKNAMVLSTTVRAHVERLEEMCK